ncbi:MAG: LytR family transcriptional regulator [Lachnospiraceae bacterium]|nr:LytR family transcriptional regulator [Lachnospiraceae bacterium]
MGNTNTKKTSGKKRLTKAERQKKKRNRIILITVEVFVLFLMLMALYVVSLYGKIEKTDISEDDIVINQGIAPSNDTVNKDDIATNEISSGHMDGYRNVALFGVDSRDNSLGKGTRSDTIIIASINEETKEVKLVSVYRDTYLNLGNDSYGKANAAYAQGGPLQAINMLNMNLDMNITDYVTVGWAGVADTIDALGGIEIDVDEAEISHLNNYQVETSKSLGEDSFERVTKTGMQTLNGIQAVSYCRIRYTAGDDFKRAERQQEVIQAILDKAKSGNIATLNKAANTIFEEISTSLTFAEVMDLLADVASYSIGATGGFPNEQYRTTGSVGAASCVISTNVTEDVKQLHQFLFGSTEGYAPSSQVETIAAQVKNRTGR